ncbi:hypothetical protein AQ490_26465 [Wenjunlia vitaminophila]|uniref:YncI copper-binding domain-containing protein n=2 Tax=Wenjunlia vitaminophila TaxID=76728 RepID=A0A0T6LPQ4_WENVI|nr:hypothetical protein AQ490_26465 [Wenjunlia vitaminophila]
MSGHLPSSQASPAPSLPRRRGLRTGAASRVAAVGVLAGSAVVLLSGTASAHVSVQPGEAARGSYSKLVFKVPNERDDAGTTKVEVTLPADHPVASVQTQPVPGWDVKVTRTKLDKPLEVHGEQVKETVSKITWTGGTIEPGTFQEFPISVGPLPEDTDTMVFKALQTYEGGEVVRWIEEPREGAEEPENPAPVLRLTEAEDDQHGAASDDQDADDGEDEANRGTNTGDDGKDLAGGSDTDSSDTTARALGITGIVVGVLGAGVGVLGLRRRGGGTPAS